MKRSVCCVLIAIGFVIGLPLSVQAQTHPCDSPDVTTVQTNGGGGFGFCHSGKDADGNPVVVTSFRVTVDGTTVFTGPLVAIGAPNAAGLSYYETPKSTIVKGTHTALAFASNADGESVGSDPFVFIVKGVPPGKPVIKKIIK